MGFLPILSFLLPFLGKVLLTIPYIPNKAIPVILGSLNIAHKYWLLLGFPEWRLNVMGDAGEPILLAGIGSFLGANVLPVIWGCAEQYLFHRFYEGKRAEARLENRVSWWEKGKASRW